MEQFWGVAQIKPGVRAIERREFEFRGRTLLEPACFAAARAGLEAEGFRVFAPATVERRWKLVRAKGYLGRSEPQRVKGAPAAFPLFPGYLFFGWNGSDDWAAAPHARGVLDVVRDGDRQARPALIPFWKMLMLMAAGEQIDAVGDLKAPACELAVGDRTEITSGPFAGMFAFVTKFENKRRLRAFLELEDLGAEQAFDLKIETSELKRTPPLKRA